MKTSKKVMLYCAIPLGLYGFLTNSNFLKPILLLLLGVTIVIGVEYAISMFSGNSTTLRKLTKRK